MASDKKPNSKQPTGRNGGMVPQKPKPPVTGHPGAKDPTNTSYLKGQRPTPRGGGGTASNKKPTP